MTDPQGGVEGAGTGSELEELLLREGLVTEAQLSRARRMSRHLRRSLRPGEVLVEMGQVARAEYERVLRKHRASLPLAAILREQGALDEGSARLYDELRERHPGRSERDLLVGENLVGEEAFLQALALQHDLQYVVPDPGLVDPGILDRISLPYLERLRMLPLRMNDGELLTAMADPLDAEARAELERNLRVLIRPCAAAEARIRETLLAFSGLRGGRDGHRMGRVEYVEVAEETPADAEAAAGAVGMLDYLLVRAVQLRASDVHIEPTGGHVRVRVRVDGVLQTLTDLPTAFGPQVVSRVKVLAGADIAERRLHQDGRFFVRVEGREVDVRVSCYASVFGETVALRLLDRRRGLLALEQLGLEPRMLQGLREQALRTSSGLVLVVGPTSSGKTTTLYSFVDYVNSPTHKTISCEDPVEYVLDGVTQCSVNVKSGPTFPDSLRAIVRQDPDIIVVGEIRDHVTATMAVEAALTGHKVFSTFHADDAVGAIVRLNNMGIEPFLVASTICCVVAQRLVRRICPDCRRPAPVGRENLRFLGFERADLTGEQLHEGAGCPACRDSGYRGRVGIHEVLLPDDDFRDAVLRRCSSRELRQIARGLPSFLTLEEAGLLKAITGQTTLSEVVANAPHSTGTRRPEQLRELSGQTRGRGTP